MTSWSLDVEPRISTGVGDTRGLFPAGVEVIRDVLVCVIIRVGVTVVVGVDLVEIPNVVVGTFDDCALVLLVVLRAVENVTVVSLENVVIGSGW